MGISEADLPYGTVIPDEKLIWKEHGKVGARRPNFLNNSFTLSKIRKLTWMISKVCDQYFNIGACAELESNVGFHLD